MPNKSYSLKTNMQDILDEITQVSSKLVEDQVTRFNQNNELHVALDMITIESDLGISLSKYCSKTGQLIGYYSTQEYEMMQRVFSNDKIKFYIERKSIEQVASHWIYTDGKSLKNLSEVDPYGYFVYALTCIFGTYQAFLKKNTASDDTHWRGKKIWLDHKIIAYKNTSEKPINLIIECNELIRRYLTLVQSSRAYHLLKWSFTDITKISDTESRIRTLLTDIRKNIERIIKHEYRAKRIKQHVTYADIVAIKDIYQGHSNFRAQRKPKEITDIEMIMHELEAFMPDEKKMPILVGDRYEKPKKQKPVSHTGSFTIKAPEPKQTKSLADIFGGKSNA